MIISGKLTRGFAILIIVATFLGVSNALVKAVNKVEDKADRFIIKYQNDQGCSESRKALKDALSSSQEFNVNQHQNFDVITTKTKQTKYDLLSRLKSKKLDQNIAYIQPDYEMKTMSNDPQFASQWGLSNYTQVKTGQLSSQDGTPSDTPAVFDKESLTSLTGDRVNLDWLIHGLQQLPIDDAQYRILLDSLRDNNKPVNNDVLYSLINDYAATNSTYINMLKKSLPGDLAETLFGNNNQIQNSYQADAGVVPAWQLSEGNGVLVAVLDTGIDITHEDLAENIWTNRAEIPGNGIDDDGNGYLDDVNGFNFYGNNNLVHQASLSNDEVHGTQMAGIIAAIKDNSKGIAGVAPEAKILPLKVFENGKAYTSDIINAIAYAEKMGAKVANCSWGSSADNPALKEAIAGSNMLFVFAAGNSSANIEQTPVYPASFDLPNIITVASINKTGSLSGFSNYGETSVDVAAPGEAIISTTPGNAYGADQGTSVAAAFVSGEAALLFSEFENLNTSDIKQRIINSADKLSTLGGKTYQGRKINCANAVNGIYPDNVIIIVDNYVTGVNGKTGSSSADFSLFTVEPPTGQFTSIASSVNEYHTLALKDDGTVWAWGINSEGQLGNGTHNDSFVPIQVPGLTGVKAISAGALHSIALKNDGTVWTWGANWFGELGDGTDWGRSTPVQVTGLTGVTAIAGGTYHTIALKNDGTVWTWGYNGYGQLGDGTTTNRYTPVQVSGLTGITAIAGGFAHTIALKNDGAVWAWGDNGDGQLGDGTTIQSTVPVLVSDLTGVTAIAGGNYHSIALKNDGTVRTWGYNGLAQLGDDTRTNRSTPVQVIGLTGVLAISGGGVHTIALRNDGLVWTWGYNLHGQLGDGTTIDKKTPVQVSGLTGVKSISGGNGSTYSLKNDGTVWAWGYNSYGQLGDGTTTDKHTPAWVLGSPLAAQDLLAVAGDTIITLTWPIAANATGYDIEVDGTAINNGTNTTFIHSGLSFYSTHTYRYRIKYATGNSAWSPLITVNTGLTGGEAGAGTMIYDYDNLNRLEKVTYSNGQVFSYIYDSAGNLLSVIKTSQ